MPKRRNGFIVDDLTGVILAGGKSRRFGSDKAFAVYKGESLIDGLLRLMKGIFRDVMVVTNFPEKYRSLPVRALTDESPFQGPAGGILTALKSVKTDGIFAVACDMPLLSRETILHLLEKDDGSPAVLYRHKNGIEPLCSIYRLPLLPVLGSRLRAGRRDLQGLQGIQEVPFTGFPDSFRNVNTPQDLKTLISPFNQQRPSNTNTSLKYEEDDLK